MRYPRLAVIGATAALAAALAGCGAGPRDEVRDKVNQFAQAAAQRDYATICHQVLAPSLTNRLVETGISCVQALRVALGGVRSPALSIGRITIRGSHASVITLTTARNQQAALSAIELVRTRDGWRVSSLGSPLAAAAR